MGPPPIPARGGTLHEGRAAATITMQRSLLLLSLGLIHLGPGCASAPSQKLAVESVEPRSPTELPPRYQSRFQALQAAMAAGEDQMARRIAGQLRSSMELERSSGVDVPPAILEVLEGMERVLKGRELVSGLRMELEVREADGVSVEVILRAQSIRRTRVTFRPGPSSLRVHRVTLIPGDGGKEGRGVRTQGVGELELELDFEGWTEVLLGRFSTALQGNAMAARTRWSLDFRAGEIIEEDESYPAMGVPSVVAERVDLAPVLPTSPVEPAELARFAAQVDPPWLPLLERAVRIHPDRREEALDRLTVVLARKSDGEVSRMVPVIRWLAPTSAPGRDPLRWRVWLDERARRRALEKVGAPETLDLGLGDRRFR